MTAYRARVSRTKNERRLPDFTCRVDALNVRVARGKAIRNAHAADARVNVSGVLYQVIELTEDDDG